MRKRREYSQEFKEAAVELVLGGRSAREAAEELGIHATNLSRWVLESREGKNSNLRVFPGKGNARDEEVARLKKENADLRETNEILKKAMAIFAEKKPR